jgi:hypothetical protein
MSTKHALSMFEPVTHYISSLIILWSWRWKRYAGPKHRFTSNELHCVMSRRIENHLVLVAIFLSVGNAYLRLQNGLASTKFPLHQASNEKPEVSAFFLKQFCRSVVNIINTVYIYQSDYWFPEGRCFIYDANYNRSDLGTPYRKTSLNTHVPAKLPTKGKFFENIAF